MEHVGSLLLGLGNGAVFAGLALALVLTYRSSGVINFASGATALFAAFTYAGLRDGELILIIPGLPSSVDVGSPLDFPSAASIALALTALLGALLYLLVFRPLRNSPPLARAVASLGVLVVLQEMMAIKQGTSPVVVEEIFQRERWELGEIVIQSDRFYLAVTILALTLVLSAANRWTRFGLTTRAAAETEAGAYVSGISPDKVALLNWMLSSAVAGAAGILIAPVAPITPITYTLFVVPALVAAVVGGFQHLVPTALAGIAIGMLQTEATALAGKHPDWFPGSGNSEVVTLLIVLVALLLVGRGIPVRGGLLRQQLGKAPRPRSLVVPTAVGFLVGLVALLVTDGTWRAAVIATFLAGIIGLSLVVVTGYAGQVSLAQLSLAGVSAFTVGELSERWDVPFLLSVLIGAIAATVVGVVIGLPALRLRGLTLGIVTLAFAYAIEAVWFRNPGVVPSGGLEVGDPSLFGWDLGVGSGLEFPRIEFGLMALVAVVAVAWGVARLRTSSLGSAMLAVRANERSAAGLGIDVTRVKVLSFAIASFIAGLGGALLAYRRGGASYQSFSALGNLTLISTAYLAGVTSVYGGILAGVMSATGIVFIAIDRWVDFGTWFPVISGTLVILTVIFEPEGVAAGGHRIADAVARRRRPPAETSGEAVMRRPSAVEPTAGALRPVIESSTSLLRVESLTVRYGGVIAVDGVTLSVGQGTVVGLIGPNGAGKTSVIDAITGFAAAQGSVFLDGDSLDGLAPHVRVRRGLARTFQAIELYDDLSVEENVKVASFGSGTAEREAAVDDAFELLGIAALRARTAGELSQGERQLVSMARACAARPKVLLLDEPAAGLDSTESLWLGERIRNVAASGTGVLLVDHDVNLVLTVCDHIYVLDFGKLIASGDPTAIRANRAVADAYLGGTHDTAETA